MLTISVKYFQTAYIFSLVSPFLFPAQEKFSACPETLILLFYNFGIEVYTCKCFLPHKHTKSNIDASKRHLEGITKAHPWKNVKNREEKNVEYVLQSRQFAMEEEYYGIQRRVIAVTVPFFMVTIVLRLQNSFLYSFTPSRYCF